MDYDSHSLEAPVRRGLSRYWGSVTVLPDGGHIPHVDQVPEPGPIDCPRGYVGQRTLSAPGPTAR
ncbi:MAG TPA: hypothetical protein PKX87_05420 [Alphaproteobacteria bacterium]|nr:hypothetical protein [Alphaproteobacteria bacterium]